jgi:23S rRNA (cytidine2498-2'-O)-methyltransferase
MNNTTLYLAPRGFENELEKELTNIVAHKGRLFIAKGGVQKQSGHKTFG